MGLCVCDLISGRWSRWVEQHFTVTLVVYFLNPLELRLAFIMFISSHLLGFTMFTPMGRKSKDARQGSWGPMKEQEINFIPYLGNLKNKN